MVLVRLIKMFNFGAQPMAAIPADRICGLLVLSAQTTLEVATGGDVDDLAVVALVMRQARQFQIYLPFGFPRYTQHPVDG